MTVDTESLVGRRADDRWNRTSVGDLFERLTWSTPDKTALVGAEGAYAYPANRRLSYLDADRLANRVANALLARGLNRGDVVMLFCDNSVEAMITKIGVAKAGLVVAPLNTLTAPDVIAGLIDLVTPALTIVDGSIPQPVLDVFSAAGHRPAVTIPIGGDALDGSTSFADLVDGQPDAEPEVAISGDDIWEIFFTSGTTSAPKGVMVSHTSSYFTGYGFALDVTRGLRVPGDLVLCSFLPMIYHVGELPFFFSTLLSGGTFVVGRRPDPAAIAQAVADEQVTALWGGSPAMLTALDQVLTARPDLDASSLTIAVYGWAALEPKVLASLKQRCNPAFSVFAIFGQTEAIACHRFWPDSWRDLYERTAPRDNYVGVPSPILASKIVDPLGEDLPPGSTEPGEAVYRSPSVTAGYYRNPEATAEAFRGGWFHSGDSCVVGESGQRIMVDRYKDIVKTGGENVSTLRVEAMMIAHPDVARVAVVGLPHDKWGEAVTAMVVPEPESQLSAHELIAWSRDRLAGFETPKRVVFVDSLPDTVGGKVLKYKLRRAFADLYTDGEQ